ncbi:26800_t:CDS:2 [Dentiscutata erythropus]|uniref:26800_t:CDS:1 n=1 Tax=Dentiscutata erythropus TaxID=1348616 RepID=A0A9N9J046_9GLOM|nr:26800_t:CDS:2 [Dentiscutata erythropus]
MIVVQLVITVQKIGVMDNSLSNNQEIITSEVVERINNTLTISEVVDLIILSIEANDQL